MERGLVGYTRIDCHSLGRMRKRDRHAVPSVAWDCRRRGEREDDGEDVVAAPDDGDDDGGDPNLYQIEESTVQV